MTLTSKQRKTLRSMANTMDSTLIVGKSDVNEAVAQQASEELEARELIKGSVLDSSNLTAREACDALCERTGAEPVQVIGRRFVIYRRSSRKDFEHIELD